MREQLKAAVIEWLGQAYDGEGRYPGNPDYRNEAEVDELVAALVALKLTSRECPRCGFLDR